MKSSCNFIGWLGALVLVAVFTTGSSLGQGQTFAPGEIVIVNLYGKPDEAQVVRQDASGVLVRQKDWQDGTYKPDGPTRYVGSSEVSKKVRKLSGSTPIVVKPAPPGTPETVPGIDAKPAATPEEAPLTKEEVVSFLRERVGTDGPHPMREKICTEMRELIKKRGVDFNARGTTWDEIFAAGGDMSVKYVIDANFGKPPDLKWILDEWDVSFTGRGGFSASLDRAAKLGFLAIEEDHKYLWKLSPGDPPEKWINGKWRDATAKEMNYYGGAGVVLLKGEQGEDWIVHKDDHAPRDQDWINIATVEYRQVRRGGKRVSLETKDPKP